MPRGVYPRNQDPDLCTKCKENPRGGVNNSWCPECTRERALDRALERHYWITRQQYDELHAEQDGKCAICGQAETRTQRGEVQKLAVDHCHSTGEIRGLLCGGCNTALGSFGDDINLILNAAKYLANHQIPGASLAQALLGDEGSERSTPPGGTRAPASEQGKSTTGS